MALTVGLGGGRQCEALCLWRDEQPAEPEPPLSSTDWTDAEYSGLAHSFRACCGPGPGLAGWSQGIRAKMLAFVGRQAVGKRNLSKGIVHTVESWGWLAERSVVRVTGPGV